MLDRIKRKILLTRKEKFYLTSFPKSGRTWLGFLMGEYFVRLHRLSVSDPTKIYQYCFENPAIPFLKFQHDDTPFWKAPDQLEHSKTKYKSDKIILLVRDPRDIMVSGFFHKSKRHLLKSKEERLEQKKPVFKGNLSDYLREPVGGIKTIIAYYNIWWSERNEVKDFLLMRYEDLSADTFGEAMRMFKFLGISHVDTALLKEVIEFTTFENLKKLETQNHYNLTFLRPQNTEDPESFKVRRGKIGGYVDYLSEEEIDFLNREINGSLNPVFGYNQSS